MLGWLTKQSKGGFTANWNRRAFALIGSSLFYEKNYDTLAVNPKLWAQLEPGCEVFAWDGSGSPHANVFAIRFPEGSKEPHLLLAADTYREKLTWLEVLSSTTPPTNPQSRPNHAPITPQSHPDHTPITPQSLPNHSPITSQSPPPKKGALERLVGRRVPSGACHHAAHAALAQPDAAHRAAVDGRGLAGAPGPPLEGLVRAALANLEGDERRAEEELRRLDARDAPRLSQECLRVCQFS